MPCSTISAANPNVQNGCAIAADLPLDSDL